MWAYTLLAGENDTPDAAAALATLARAFADRHGVRPRVSLIPFNPSEGLAFQTPSRAAIDAFRDALGTLGVGSILRYSGGGDVAAACGQLAPVAGFRAGRKLA
jgi:23S rRNA (adenine2503-C2)-methyltransferase